MPATRPAIRPWKSIGTEDTFAEDLFDLETASQAISSMAEKVWRSCEKQGITGRTVTIKVKYADFRLITRSKTATSTVQSRTELETLVLALLQPLFPVEKGIRLLGVTLSSLCSASGTDVAGAQLRLWG